MLARNGGSAGAIHGAAASEDALPGYRNPEIAFYLQRRHHTSLTPSGASSGLSC